QTVDTLQWLGGLQWTQKLDRLTGSQQLDGDDALYVFDHLQHLSGGEAAHRDVVLLAGRSGQRVDRGRMAKDLVLRDCNSDYLPIRSGPPSDCSTYRARPMCSGRS